MPGDILPKQRLWGGGFAVADQRPLLGVPRGLCRAARADGGRENRARTVGLRVLNTQTGERAVRGTTSWVYGVREKDSHAQPVTVRGGQPGSSYREAGNQ